VYGPTSVSFSGCSTGWPPGDMLDGGRRVYDSDELGAIRRDVMTILTHYVASCQAAMPPLRQNAAPPRLRVNRPRKLAIDRARIVLTTERTPRSAGGLSGDVCVRWRLSNNP
jgi:hypothetical protein